jgi:DNA-3-methyladenine glycosylase II
MIISFSDEEYQSLKAKDKKLASYIDLVGPIVREGIEDPYLALLDNIIAQQVSLKAAISISKRFFEQFPNGAPQDILDASIEELRACGLSSSKAQYLKNCADAKGSGRIQFEKLKELDSKSIHEKLIQIKGVGRWTVEMLLIFSLQKKDILSYGDLAIRKGMEKLYRKTLTLEFFEKKKRKLYPQLTLASFYFWHASQNKNLE